MSKENYLEVCEAMGNEPSEDEIPLELDDLLPEVAQAYNMYSLLSCRIDSMAGIYLGKDFSGLETLFDMHDISKSDRLDLFKIMLILDSIDVEHANAKK